MNRIAKLLPARNVLLDLQVSSKKRVFEQVALLFENEHGIERGKVFDSLFARERLGSTGLGQSVAIPHGRIKGLKDAIAAVVRVTEPIPFDAPDGQAVRLLVFLLVLVFLLLLVFLVTELRQVVKNQVAEDLP
jgi:PTS system nitrogen regulatory IIA component